MTDVTAFSHATHYFAYVRAKAHSTVEEAVAMSMAQFLVTELALAKTFARLAATTDDSTKRTRCIANARKAYDAVLELLPRAPLSHSETEQIRAELLSLGSKIEALGEMFPISIGPRANRVIDQSAYERRGQKHKRGFEIW